MVVLLDGWVSLADVPTLVYIIMTPRRSIVANQKVTEPLKRTYAAPKFVEYGSVQRLTASGSGSRMEGTGEGNKFKMGGGAVPAIDPFLPFGE